MSEKLLIEIEHFMAETGLSEHRTGILLAKNGRLVERLREKRRFWPETITAIKESLAREVKARKVSSVPCQNEGTAA